MLCAGDSIRTAWLSKLYSFGGRRQLMLTIFLVRGRTFGAVVGHGKRLSLRGDESVRTTDSDAGGTGPNVPFRRHPRVHRGSR
jgi:hypothetical protein